MDHSIQTAEGSDQTPNDSGAESPDQSLRLEISDLKQSQHALLSKIEELTLAMKPQPQPVNIAELYAKDPASAIAAVVDSKVKEALHPAMQTLTREQQKKHYDEKAEREFPQLRTDPEYQRAVRDNVKELINAGGMDKNSPALVYLAAERAALRHKSKSASGNVSQPGEMSGGAPASAGMKADMKSSQGTDQNFERLAAMFGIKNKDRMKERLTAQTERGKR